MRLENILELLLVGASSAGVGKLHHAYRFSRKHPGIVICLGVG